MRIEAHYGSPQDTEWAFDADGEVWMLQSRPVTSDRRRGPADAGPRPARAGRAASAPPRASRAGPVRVIAAARGRRRAAATGEVLVTHMTAPDWVPLMRRAAAIVTDSGGMTCHAAIVSRELGHPLRGRHRRRDRGPARRRARHRRRRRSGVVTRGRGGDRGAGRRDAAEPDGGAAPRR